MWVRLYLVAIGLMFVAFGTWAMLDPAGMTSELGVTVSGPNGLYEMRGIYGGVSLGAGVLGLLGALREAYRRPALLFLVVYFGGYMAARALALALGPAPTPVFAGFIAFEAAGLIGALIALRAEARRTLR